MPLYPAAGVNAAADAFRPVHLRSLTFDPPENRFRILLDKGDTPLPTAETLKASAARVMDYFLTGIVLPDDSFWVNLRPDSPERVIDAFLEKTDAGRVMLEADVNLKKDLARLTSPDTPEGRRYWNSIYQKAQELFGQPRVNVPAYTRPWIVPGEIVAGRSHRSAYIYKAALKVELEQDWIKSPAAPFTDPRMKELNEYSAALIRASMLPLLTKIVNRSKRYAELRQVYYSLIMAQWFKREFGKEENAYSGLIDSRDLSRLSSGSSWKKETYFRQYKRSFEEGEYNKSETAGSAYGPVVRQYISGGVRLYQSAAAVPAPGGLPPAVRFPGFSGRDAAIEVKLGEDSLVINIIDGRTVFLPGGRDGRADADLKSDVLLIDSLGREVDPADRLRIAGELGVDTRPVAAGLMDPLQAGYEMEQKKAVNPDDAGITAVYAGSGSNWSDFILATNAPRAYFVDLQPVSREALLEALGQWQSLGESAEDRQFLDRHRRAGYTTSAITPGSLNNISGVERKFMLELKAMGVVKLRPDGTPNIVVSGEGSGTSPLAVSFEWSYAGSGSARSYSVTFINANIADPLSYPEALERILADGIDVYYQKAGFSIPKGYARFMPVIGRSLRDNGSIISGDICWEEFNPYPWDLDPVLAYIPAAVFSEMDAAATERMKRFASALVQSRARDEAAKFQSSGLEDETAESLLSTAHWYYILRYGWEVHIRRKLPGGKKGSGPALYKQLPRGHTLPSRLFERLKNEGVVPQVAELRSYSFRPGMRGYDQVIRLLLDELRSLPLDDRPGKAAEYSRAYPREKIGKIVTYLGRKSAGYRRNLKWSSGGMEEMLRAFENDIGERELFFNRVPADTAADAVSYRLSVERSVSRHGSDALYVNLSRFHVEPGGIVRLNASYKLELGSGKLQLLLKEGAQVEGENERTFPLVYRNAPYRIYDGGAAITDKANSVLLGKLERPDPLSILQMSREGLSDAVIMSAASNIDDLKEYSGPQMGALYKEIGAMMPYLYELAGHLKKNYPGHTFLFIGRDGEMMYDIMRVVLSYSGEGNKAVLFPGSTKLMEKIRFEYLKRPRDREALKDYFGQFGITKESILNGEKFLLIDTGFEGSIARTYLWFILEDLFGLKYGRVKEALPIQLVSTFGFKGPAGSEIKQLQLHKGDSLDIFSIMDPFLQKEMWRWESVRQRRFNMLLFYLAASMQCMPRYFNEYRKIIRDPARGYLAVSEWNPLLFEPNVNKRLSWNDSIINPVAAFMVQRYVVARAAGDIDNKRTGVPVLDGIMETRKDSGGMAARVSGMDGGSRLGGIDFRNLPVRPGPVRHSNDPAVPPDNSAIQLSRLEAEWKRIEDMTKEGRVPSPEELKRYLVSCCRKGDCSVEAAQTLACISEILRLEETAAEETDPGFLGILSALESYTRQEDLPAALGAL